MKLFSKHSAAALFLLGLGLAGCQPEISDPKPSAGQADFSRYIAVGNSLTAGYSDNGLYLEGQQNSYPSILAQQFAKVGGGNFVQPLFPAANAAGTGYVKLAGFSGANPVIVSEDGSFTGGVVAPGTPTNTFATGRAFVSATLPLLVRYAGTDNQNLGVPGIRIADITTADYGRLTANSNAGNFNPLFERLLPTATDSRTYLDYVKERVATIKPTFFTNWLGNNDVLGYAASGGTGAPLTSVTEFTDKYNQSIDALTSGGAKGLVATIPSVTTTPLFTTVSTAAVAAQINATPVPATLIASLAPLGLTATQIASARFGLFIRTSGTGAAAVREATTTDLLLLPASTYLRQAPVGSPLPNGVGLVISGLSAAQATGLAGALPPNALPNSLVLDASEASNVASRTTELNNVIIASAQRKGLAVFDANSYFNGISRNGLVVNGVNNSAAFVTGNLFSLDGVHPTPRGYAVVANEMIRTINAYYGSVIPGVDATQYRGVRFPQ